MWDRFCSSCTGETLEINDDGSRTVNDTEMTISSTEVAMLNNDHSDMETIKRSSPYSLRNSSHSKTVAFTVASSIYGQLLVVICLAFFTTEIVTAKIPLSYFEGFYMYLYIVSLIFLVYVYVYLLHGNGGIDKKESCGKKKISETEKSHGSIFLRIGAVGFGLGTMVYNGLLFGSFFEIPQTSPCYSLILGLNPVLQAIFTFAQMYFIFTTSRLMINKFKLLARLGLMHLVATNLCVWIRTLGKETLQELKASTSNIFLEELILPLRSNSRSLKSFSAAHNNQTVNNSNPCQKEDIMGTVLADTSPYLYPFIVEYSLISAAFLYVMWSNIGKNNSKFVSENSSQITSASVVVDDMKEANNTHIQSTTKLYSCLGSSKGLFTGFLFMVISITSLIIFFVLVHHPHYKLLATLISDISHSLILLASCLAIIAAFFKIRKLHFQPAIRESADGGLQDILLKVGAFGLYIYSLFGVIAGLINIKDIQHFTVLFTSLLTIIQVTLQSLFISDVVCRRRSTEKQPGRQLITFLLIANLTIWIIYTFQMQKVEASPVQLHIYGFTTWALILRITLPLSIFYRFHSAITFAEVWKNSYK